MTFSSEKVKSIVKISVSKKEEEEEGNPGPNAFVCKQKNVIVFKGHLLNQYTKYSHYT